MNDLQDRVNARALELITEWKKEIARASTTEITECPLGAHDLSALRLQAVIEVFGDRIASLEEEVQRLSADADQQKEDEEQQKRIDELEEECRRLDRAIAGRRRGA